jgi:hypothetical protein
MKQQLNSLDSEKYIGRVTLSDGETRLDIPKLSMLKIIRIVKFLGIDGIKIYEECREVLLDKELDDISKFATILENLKEEQLIHILSIMLEKEDKETLAFDHNETLDILLVYADKYEFAETFTKVRQLMKKMFNKEIPDLPELMDKMFPKKAEVKKEPTPVPPKQPEAVGQN